MSMNNFIPTIWSETLYSALNKQYVAVNNCNRDYEGDIREQGSTVKICNVGEISVGNYTKNANMDDPQELNTSAQELCIDQAKFFNFQIDDIDRAQSAPKVMSEAMRAAAAALAKEADARIFRMYEDAGCSITKKEVDVNNILDILISARTVLNNQGVTDMSDVVIEVSPAVAALILRAKIALSTDNGEMLENGCIGSIAGCRVFVSSNVVQTYEDDSTYHKCFVRTKRSIAFAEQLSEIEAYRPEKRFADAIKGLHLYGAKVLNPLEMVVLNLSLKIE